MPFASRRVDIERIWSSSFGTGHGMSIRRPARCARYSVARGRGDIRGAFQKNFKINYIQLSAPSLNGLLAQ